MALRPAPEKMTADTIFDVASLTKVVATAPSIVRLAEEGKLRLADPVTRYIPDLAAGGGERGKVTIEQLLTHRAGLLPDDPLDLSHKRQARVRVARAAKRVVEAQYQDVVRRQVGNLTRRLLRRDEPCHRRRRAFAQPALA